MAHINRFDPTYRMHELPQLAHNHVLYYDTVVYTGSKIERYVKGFGLYKHEAFIYGTGVDGTIWIIENNLNGVECVSFRDFMQGMSNYKVYPNLNPLIIGIILDRAEERALLVYNTRDNNCQTFVTYCLTGKCESIQVVRTEIAAEILITCAELYLMVGSVNPKVIENYTKARDAIKLKRPKGWQAEVEKYTQRSNQVSEMNSTRTKRKTTGRRATKSKKEIISLTTNMEG